MDPQSVEEQESVLAGDARANLDLYRWMRMARCIDAKELELVARGEAFFQVSCTGHESSAALAAALQPEDFLHCHYRDKALLLARGVPASEFFDALLTSGHSNSAGRQMSAHLSAPALNVLSLVGPVGNNALQAVGIAQHIKQGACRPLVVCSVGDGTTQQGEVLEAIAEAVRSTLPVLFLIHDNGYSISTRTAGRTFFSLPGGDADTFYGLPIHRIDGRDPTQCQAMFRKLTHAIRADRRPVLSIMQVDRLCSHTNADDDSVYRDAQAVAGLWEAGDPLQAIRFGLLAAGIAEVVLARLDEAVLSEIRIVAEDSLLRARRRPPPPFARHCSEPLPTDLAEYRGVDHVEPLSMTEALREVLRAQMAADDRVTLYGQDIEDPKGDVFGVTRGLTHAFPGRVQNSPLSESTIVGASIGRALAGGRPVAFLQFADFLPLAFNQLASELATMHWRTCGGWRAPVVVLVACGGYRPGLGPFHAQTFESIVAHLPGIDVAMPASAGDAAGMLNAAFHSERPTVLFYPKALLNERGRGTSPDVARQIVPIGRARVVRRGDALTLVAWGNTVPLCERVAATLELAGSAAEVIDLRWLSPWDRDTVLASARKTRRLLVAHEDNARAGFGAELIAAVTESLLVPVQCRRVARPDTFVPCHYATQLEVLPSYRRILEAAADLIGLEVSWEQQAPVDQGVQIVPVLGSSPADRTVELVELAVRPGMAVKAGQLLASVEADKAVMDLASPVDGVVAAVHLHLGDRVAVGTPLLTLATGAVAEFIGHPEESEIARLAPRQAAPRSISAGGERADVMITGLATCRGRGRLSNTELLARLPELRVEDDAVDAILARTGIETRLVAESDQDVVNMAVEAATLALCEAGIRAEDLALVICSTSTPQQIAPSTACQVLRLLATQAEVPAYDLSAACSGFLYALANAWDFLQQHPQAHVLVLTSETMRQIVDIDDPVSSPIFGDAATATVVSNVNGRGRPLAIVCRPVLGGAEDETSALTVPLPGDGAFVRMDGKKVFSQAVRRMGAMLERACLQAELSLADLSTIVPHQANGRIIGALRTRLNLPSTVVWDELREQGNTSSSSIPLALNSVLRRADAGPHIGLCAFGAGFTFGGAVLHRFGKSREGQSAS